MSFEVKKGTNISHWLSQTDARGDLRKSRFTRDDAMMLADMGLDHLRLPIDEVQMWDKEGKKEAEAWDLLNQGLDWCREGEMKAVVDLHILRSHFFNDDIKPLFDDPAEGEKFGQLWRELSGELSGRSNEWVGYELLNEAVADDPEDWNRVLQIPYKVIRELEPERNIAIGSNRWCQAETYVDLKVPENDKNITLVFHYYNPMFITHYRAYWCWFGKDYDGPINYPGTPIPDNIIEMLDPAMRKRVEEKNEYFDLDVMEEHLAPALAMSKRMGLPLWCNEFGVIRSTPDDIRKRWLLDMKSVFEKHNIGWSVWDFRSEFGLFDGYTGKATAVAEALIGDKCPCGSK
ncbi:MAG: cellulase family glycosylhydrolase [Planctomycetes bacterium]|nr:cellulase family glycosylhydrolase [Planctomycetota bacterium]